VVTEAQEIQLAIELIQLGARLQLLETEVSLSRERLLKLYKELRGVSPPKGMLPFSTDWFLTWQPNIHSSLFINIHRFLVEHAGATGIETLPRTDAAGFWRRAFAVADAGMDVGAFFSKQDVGHGAMHEMPWEVRGQLHGPEPGLLVRAVPHAFARRQNQKVQGRRRSRARQPVSDSLAGSTPAVWLPSTGRV